MGAGWLGCRTKLLQCCFVPWPRLRCVLLHRVTVKAGSHIPQTVCAPAAGSLCCGADCSGFAWLGIEPRLMLVLLELLPNQSLKGADFTLLRRASTAEACAGLNAATASSPSRMQLQSKQGLKLREGIHLCHRLSGGRACLRLACIVPAY